MLFIDVSIILAICILLVTIVRRFLTFSLSENVRMMPGVKYEPLILNIYEAFFGGSIQNDFRRVCMHACMYRPIHGIMEVEGRWDLLWGCVSFLARHQNFMVPNSPKQITMHTSNKKNV